MMKLLIDSYILGIRELKKWYRRRVVIILNFITPIFWLGLFGKSLNFYNMFKIPENMRPEIVKMIRNFIDNIILSQFGTQDYFTYMAAGMFSIFVLFSSIFSGLSLVFDRRLGYLDRLLVSPIKREAIFFSKLWSTGVRNLLQFTAIFLIAIGLGIKFGEGFGIYHLIGIYLTLGLLSTALTAIFLSMAVKIENHDTVIATANLLNLPLMFTSNALFPLDQMPDWLKTAAMVNPITYTTDNVRRFILGDINETVILINFIILIILTIMCVIIGIITSRKAFS